MDELPQRLDDLFDLRRLDAEGEERMAHAFGVFQQPRLIVDDQRLDGMDDLCERDGDRDVDHRVSEGRC